MILPLILALALQRQAQSAYDRQQLDRQAEERTKELPKPVFLKTPTADDIQAAYPPDALAKQIAGSASVHCKVDKNGALAGCSVVSETPARKGFGDAALKVAKVFQLSPKASDGTNMVGQSLTIPMQFNPG